MDTTEHTAIPYEQYKAEAARLRREAMAGLFGRLGRFWRRLLRPNYGVGSGLATGQ